MISEADILTGCKAGKRKFQQLLFERMYGKMMVVCLRYSKNEAEALDAFQDAFIKVFNKLDTFDGSGSLEAWIKRIMINTAIDQLRRNKKYHQTYELNEEILNGENEELAAEEEDLLDKVSFEDLLNAVQDLTPAYRSVFNMYVVDGFSHHEIAQKLAISVGTSKSNLFKAKHNLKNILIQKISALKSH